MWPKHPIVLVLIFLLMTVLMACQPGRASPTLQPREKEVPFETVFSEEWGSSYDSGEPQVLLLTKPEDIAKLA